MSTYFSGSAHAEEMSVLRHIGPGKAMRPGSMRIIRFPVLKSLLISFAATFPK